ncbi:MAG: hypothetical protein KIT38_13255 [Gemmatimonadaceae bacterium]|nr:hypothetical protein [Gemmatimonadaceae bacterium]
MKIRGVRLVVETAAGVVGREVRFADGLVLVRADNSCGKSTLLLGILYALGLEGMLGPSHAVPLKHAMTSHIDVDGVEYPVLASDVLLLVESGSELGYTIRRTAVGARKTGLVTVANGDQLSSPISSIEGEDYFVRQPGAYSAERGFHNFLARLLAWDLPEVGAYAGGVSPLYMEAIFPFLFIEQARGWGAIEGRFPTHLRIREPGVRAFEFLLALSVFDSERVRAEATASVDRIRALWGSAVQAVTLIAKDRFLQIERLVTTPSVGFTGLRPEEVRVSADGVWQNAPSYIEGARARAAELRARQNSPVALVAPEIEKRLLAEERRVRELDTALNDCVRSIDAVSADLARASGRRRALEEDLQRAKDVRTLQRLGADRIEVLRRDECPTCQQSIELALLPEIRERASPPMSIAENIEYLEDQLAVVSVAANDSESALSDLELKRKSLSSDLSEARRAVRELKRELVSHPSAPDLSAAAEAVRLEERVEAVVGAMSQLNELSDRLVALSVEWGQARSLLAELPLDRFSEIDRAKVSTFRDSFTTQLAQYGFESVSNPSEIQIDEDTFKAGYRGFDLQFDLSGSDMTRATWAYRTALLEVSRQFETNHPGFLIIDEPQQQNPSQESVEAFLRRAGKSLEGSQQVVVATSETSDSIRKMTAGIECQLIDLGDGHLLRAGAGGAY